VPEPGTPAPATERLRALVQDSLQAQRPPATIASLSRRPSHYRSSYPLEELTVTLEGGGRLELMVKNANRGSLSADVLAAKPDFVYDPRREIDLYRSILAAADLGTARYYAAVTDDEAGEYWLCMETVGGVELYQVGEIATWQRVAAWLADFHWRFKRDTSWRVSPAARSVLTINRELMQAWFDRARRFAAQRDDAPAITALAALDTCWNDVVETLMAAPRTLLHGEFYASNVLVDDRRSPPRVCAVDWEMAADGPGIIDLAALTAGNWPHDEPARIVEAYVAAATARGWVWTRPAFDRALLCARVYVAVQWLGWAREWAPPADHRHDWARELSRLVDLLSGA
jgi:hypothetical protein